jgi:Putative regulator of cell autolysis
MKNNTFTKKILIFLLLALVVCLFANINQIFATYISDPHLRPNPHHFPHPHFRDDMFRYRLGWEMALSFIFAFFIIAYNAGVFWIHKREKKANQQTVVTISILAGLLLFVFLIVVFLPDRHFPSRFLSLILSKALFVIMASISAGQLYRLIWQKQQVEIENEKLKTDSIQSRYQGLMNQLNPHFLFNSLNSLSYLIRESQQDKALTFIDELSSIFRYVLQKRNDELVTLEEEIQFTEAYRYLLSIRFENKLFFEIRIDENDMKLLLPFLTLQPLIENAVKHNVISAKQPLAIFIYTDEGNLVVSNPISAKLPDGESTGIGLSNLASRYKLLTGKQITIMHDEKNFLVKIPLVSKQ